MGKVKEQKITRKFSVTGVLCLGIIAFLEVKKVEERS